MSDSQMSDVRCQMSERDKEFPLSRYGRGGQGVRIILHSTFYIHDSALYPFYPFYPYLSPQETKVPLDEQVAEHEHHARSRSQKHAKRHESFPPD